MAMDKDETALADSGGTKGGRQAGLSKAYRIQVRGEVPEDLRERISALHAQAILQRRG